MVTKLKLILSGNNKSFVLFFPLLDDVDGEKKKGSEWADTDRDYTYIEVFWN